MTKRKAKSSPYRIVGHEPASNGTMVPLYSADPQAMLKRLQKSLKDPYPRPWTVVVRSLDAEFARVVDERIETVLSGVPRALAHLIVKAVNAQPRLLKPIKSTPLWQRFRDMGRPSKKGKRR